MDAQGLLWSGTPGYLLGALGTARYVTYEWNGSTNTATYWEADTTPVSLSTDTFGTADAGAGIVMSSGEGTIALDYTDPGSAQHLVVFTASGDTLTATDTTLAAPLGTFVGISGDGAEFLFRKVTAPFTLTAVNSSGTTQWSASLTGTEFCIAPRAGRYLTINSTTVTLRDSSGSSLATETTPTIEYPNMWVTSGVDEVTFLIKRTADATGNIAYRELDTAGDTLSWTAAAGTVSPSWRSDASIVEFNAGSWGDLVVIGERYAPA